MHPIAHMQLCECTWFVYLQADAYEAYANREFSAAVDKLTEILQYDPQNPRWFEMRAQVGAMGW
jgi:hypothetical protein